MRQGRRVSEPIDPQRAVDFILRNAPRMGAAKGQRIRLEEFRKSKKALLMAASALPSVAAREQYAYAHAEYLEVLDAIGAAVELEETLRWQMLAAQIKVEVWRSQEASNRNQDRAAR